MTRSGIRARLALPALLATALAACGGELGETGTGASAAPPTARNLLLVVVDTLRADHLGLYGYERPTSPFLDRFAAERGVAFDQARATAPWTKPSVASILTGLDPRHHEVTLHHERLHSAARSLAEVLAAAGYQTAAFQSNLLLSSLFGYQQGFELYDETHLAGHDRSTGEALHDAVVRWLREERDAERPFFLYVQHYEPHFDYLRDGAAFADGPYTGGLRGDEPMDALIAATSSLTDADVDHLRARYDAEIRYQDELLERLVAELDALGLSAETAIVLTADHGEEFREHGELSHQHKLFDELVRVPLVIARPGEPRPGRRVADPVSLVDLGRTALDILGFRELAFPGHSLVPLLAGEARDELGPPVLAHARTIPNLPGGGKADAPRDLDMIVIGPWKLVRDFHTGARHLFRLDRDPGERADLAANEPERVRALEARVDAWLAEHRGLELTGAPETVELSAEMLQRLRDLGYLGEE